MAKKKRRVIEEPEEEYVFSPAEFNEREFILKDIYGSKVFGVMIGLGLVVGIIGAIICNVWHSNLNWIVATIISFAVVALGKQILTLLGFRPEMLDMKTLAGAYLMYLAFALGICIVGVNPPFA